jgi:N-carbamoyl-L-amino-acid hydrolase
MAPNSGRDGRRGPAIDADRLRRRHEEMAAIGATGRGGVNRQALSPEDGAARARLMGWAKARGFALFLDPIGNMFIRRHGRDKDALPVVAGSHLDSQPTGGNYDGVYGVLAAFEVLESLEDQVIATRRPIEVVVWTNEEGSRFSPTTMGSAVYAGAIPLADALASRDRDGVTAGEALKSMLAQLPKTESRPLGSSAHAYVEAHIEQGPVLEGAGKRIGIVSGIQGLRQFTVTVTGEEAHAGTTPRARRRDAFVTAHAIVGALARLTADRADTVRFTVGRFEVYPGSPNTVPGRVQFMIDLRHPDAGTLARLGDRVFATCRRHAAPCAVEVREMLHSKPVSFDPRMVARVRDAAHRLGLTSLDMVSGATHDAKYMADLCPTGMVFVPCRGGISHNESEWAAPEDLAAGADVLSEVVADLAAE